MWALTPLHPHTLMWPCTLALGRLLRMHCHGECTRADASCLHRTAFPLYAMMSKEANRVPYRVTQAVARRNSCGGSASSRCAAGPWP